MVGISATFLEKFAPLRSVRVNTMAPMSSNEACEATAQITLEIFMVVNLDDNNHELDNIKRTRIGRNIWEATPMR